MSKRIYLQSMFYRYPNKENLEALTSSLECAVIDHIMTKEQADEIQSKAEEYLDEM